VKRNTTRENWWAEVVVLYTISNSSVFGCKHKYIITGTVPEYLEPDVPKSCCGGTRVAEMLILKGNQSNNSLFALVFGFEV